MPPLSRGRDEHRAPAWGAAEEKLLTKIVNEGIATFTRVHHLHTSCGASLKASKIRHRMELITLESSWLSKYHCYQTEWRRISPILAIRRQINQIAQNM